MSTTASHHQSGHIGVSFPQPGTWEIDPGHTEVAFTGRHFMITKVRGRFTGVQGSVVVAEDVRDSRVQVSIDVASVQSGNATRDEHLRSAELFDVERYPTATFRSTAVTWRGREGTVEGDLTIHGVTRRVELAVVFEGQVRDPWGAQRSVFSAALSLNREDFGVTWNVALETGGVLVSKEIAITIDLEAVLAPTA